MRWGKYTLDYTLDIGPIYWKKNTDSERYQKQSKSNESWNYFLKIEVRKIMKENIILINVNKYMNLD